MNIAAHMAAMDRRKIEQAMAEEGANRQEGQLIFALVFLLPYDAEEASAMMDAGEDADLPRIEYLSHWIFMMLMLRTSPTGSPYRWSIIP